MSENLNLASPWRVYAGRVEALFAADPGVDVDYDNEGRKVTLRVSGDDKADAIERLLPSEVVFGKVKLEICVVPSNAEVSEADVYRRAFAGNRVLFDVAEGFGPAGDIDYALFLPDVVQLREDDISKFEGITTLTYEELARSVLQEGDTRICSAPRA